MDNAYLIIIISLVLINIIVSIFLCMRDDLEQFQKVAQTIIVWLIPFIGAIVMWLINRSQDNDNDSSGGPFGGGSSTSNSMSGD